MNYIPGSTPLWDIHYCHMGMVSVVAVTLVSWFLQVVC